MKNCCRRIDPQLEELIAFEREGVWRVGRLTHVGDDALIADLYPYWPAGFVRPAGDQSIVLYRSQIHRHPSPRGIHMEDKAPWHVH